MSKWSELLETANARALLQNEPLFTMMETIQKLALPPARLLEVGFGTGFAAAFLADVGYAVTGIDDDQDVIDLAKGRLEADFFAVPTMVKADAFKLQAAVGHQGPFHLAYSQGFLEHFSDDDILALLREQLKISDIVVFSVPSENYPNQEFGNERRLGLTHWLKLIEQLDEADVSIRYYGRDQHLLATLERKVKLNG